MSITHKVVICNNKSKNCNVLAKKDVVYLNKNLERKYKCKLLKKINLT